MNRRHFIEKAGLLGAAAFLPVSCASISHGPKFKMGLQLYTINQDMIKNPISSLTAVKAMGYEDFEIFGFNNEKGTFYGYKSSEFKKY